MKLRYRELAFEIDDVASAAGEEQEEEKEAVHLG